MIIRIQTGNWRINKMLPHLLHDHTSTKTDTEWSLLFFLRYLQCTSKHMSYVLNWKIHKFLRTEILENFLETYQFLFGFMSARLLLLMFL